jgi:hypothetical protein
LSDLRVDASPEAEQHGGAMVAEWLRLAWAFSLLPFWSPKR